MEQGEPTTAIGETRRRLAGFVAELTANLAGLVGGTPPGGVYSPARWALGATPVDVSLYGGSDVQPTVVAWPKALGTPPADGTCSEISGDAVTAALAGANQLTLLELDGVTYAPLLRPLLPGSTGCP